MLSSLLSYLLLSLSLSLDCVVLGTLYGARLAGTLCAARLLGTLCGARNPLRPLLFCDGDDGWRWQWCSDVQLVVTMADDLFATITMMAGQNSGGAQVALEHAALLVWDSELFSHFIDKWISGFAGLFGWAPFQLKVTFFLIPNQIAKAT